MDSSADVGMTDHFDSQALHVKYLSLQTWTPKTKLELLKINLRISDPANSEEQVKKVTHSSDAMPYFQQLYSNSDTKEIRPMNQQQSLNTMKFVLESTRKRGSFNSEDYVKSISPTKLQQSDSTSDYTFNLIDDQTKRVRFFLPKSNRK